MTESKILFVTEANEKVASGHLFECIECCREFCRQNIKVCLMVNRDMPLGLKQRISMSYDTYNSNIQEEADVLIDFVRRNRIRIVIFNLRKIENYFLQKIRKELADTALIVCIDEFGHRSLNADIIINPMIDEYYWKYDTDGELYGGAEYLVLPQKVKEYHKKEKVIRKKIETITVSMGGVDAKGTTLKLAVWLGELFDDIRLNLVIGGGFMYQDKLMELVKGKKNIKIYQNITFLYDLFMESDIAVCAGGNTLHELAALGVPTLVVPGMPHESRNGKAFERLGFSICCEEADYVTKGSVAADMKRLSDYHLRVEMNRNGKKLADGCGVDRVFEIIQNKLF